ncbi:hypothetical protein SODALDRAFT_276523 [Sodiomyces alkalinus F11]|uniref:MAU2 chromatid cohesion factor homolog n=1 Tax=Sodiomyces alkalinus (strain CBS 110278 / VKM F-3762 / F11) TaxID=1314773 RepID=A0A3N2PXJ0_SODAK|nr:hypothetical protein SODALDRAFT_276523 [Sodiomyces alkalinus F11]ROT39188.1 hypothetical protein SODALDRAFT_276523 [Sodiomyces alkalinus F11]
MSADAAPSTTEAQVWEHQKLISTGLACLEAAVHSNKLPPRQEAKARLRYASILYEETENLQEAETTLFQGIKLCEKHRYTDLRYCLQFMSLKVLFQRNQKAAFIALDKQIAECQTFKHIPWVYAFRLLKATLQTYAGNSVEIALLDNLQSLSTLAHERGDHAVGVLGSLLEGLAHLRVTKQDTVERVQTCLAQVAKYQLDPFVQVLQLDVLTLLLDLACSMHQKNPDLLVHKLSALQSRMDAGLDSKEWADGVAEMRIPLKKQHSSYHLISDDTGAILQAGSLDEGRDFVVMSFLTRAELFALVYTFSGLASLYRFHHNPAKVQRKSSELWEEGLKVIQQLASVSEAGAVTATVSRHESIRQAKWRTEMFCYLQLLTGLYCATQSRWSVVDQCLVKLQKAATQTPNDIFSLCCLYLTGVYHQGTGDLETALLLFQDSRFDIDSTLSAGGGRKPALLELCLLAALNRLWILQAPDFRDDTTTLALLEKVRPICTEHHDPEIRTAFHLVQATTRTNQPVSMQVIKTSIHSAVQTSKQIGNTHCLAIGLSIMRYQLFDNVVGEQALKSAKAASAQSKRSGNLLWMSVADGMLAHSYEVQEQMAEAQAAQKAASEYAARALIGKN